MLILNNNAPSSTLTSILTGDLPVFGQTTAEYTLLYASGCVVAAAPDAAESMIQALRKSVPSPGWGDTLRRHAVQAVQRMDQQIHAPFAPECLTLYLHNQCNLACAYCYTDPDHLAGERLQPEAIASAATLVAENCRAKGLPLTVVFHGGGEPSLFQDQVEQALALVDEAARRHGLRQFRYIATNGIMPETKVRWLADRFDLIGLSCDGTPDIQDRQRPRHGGGGTSAAMERTARGLRDIGKPFHIRVTITRASMRRQAEIAAYLCQVLAPDEIHFEPVYYGGKTNGASALVEVEARAFVEEFLAAQTIAQQHGISLTCSGSRVNAIHGAYCHVFRQVLNLVPSGTATACFKLTRREQLERHNAQIGDFSSEAGFMLDQRQISDLREQLGALPDACIDCFNRFHCTRSCPDECLLSGSVDAQSSFRCQVQQLLAYRRVRAAADEVWSQRRGESIVGVHLDHAEGVS